jgi:pyruvate formate lyase activating enzyme
LIPGTTATQENLEGISEFLSQNLNQTVQRWELCAFNNLCRDKYHRLGMDWCYSETQLLSSSELAQFESWAKQAYVNPDKVIATGATQVNVNG